MNIVLSDRQLCDLEMLLNGSYSPLDTYLNSQDYQSVVDNFELVNGDFFPIPIVLDLSESQINNISLQQEIYLTNDENLPLAKLTVSDIYKPNLEDECLKVLGTVDKNHPYVAYLLDRKETTYYVSGKLEKCQPIKHSDYNKYRLTPLDAKAQIASRGWTNIIGFQTRNPMHRCHYEVTQYLTQQVADQTGESTGLLLTPTVGVTQECDIDYFTRVKCYINLLQHYPTNSVDLCLLPLAMRMAGPREALLHAVIRRNYGCTHFIVGRDHAGPSYKPSDPSKASFYGPYDAHQLAQKYQDRLGIKILLMQEMVYVENKSTYLPVDKLQLDDKTCNISGSRLREMLLNNEPIPEWFTYPDIAKILKDQTIALNRQGICIYFVGLSGSGKSTLVKHLKSRLMEENLNARQITILDGDIVRQQLSKGLGFTAEDRSLNVRRIGYVASLVVKHGGICLVANIAPFDTDRQYNRQLIENNGKYIEVYVKTPLDMCRKRDCKGLYLKAENNEIKLTGVNDPFDEPNNSHYVVDNSNYDQLEKIVDDIIGNLKESGHLSN